jgi:hypothetical protein
VAIPLNQSALAYWDSTQSDFAVEADNVEIQIGASSADIKLKKIITPATKYAQIRSS